MINKSVCCVNFNQFSALSCNLMKLKDKNSLIANRFVSFQLEKLYNAAT